MTRNPTTTAHTDSLDAQREACPYRHGEGGEVQLLRHADVLRAVREHGTFLNRVSEPHVAIPNGMDPPEHTPFRRLVERYFTPEMMDAFEPRCREITRDLLTDGGREAGDLGRRFAVRMQCAFLGWPESMRTALAEWFERNQSAIEARDREALEVNAREFEAHVAGQLEERRGAKEDLDLTARLMREQVEGRPVTDAEIVSILRNWTAGEVGTIAASVDILRDVLDRLPEVTAWIRSHPERIGDATDEILRLRAPLPTNRRVTACPVSIAGLEVPGGRKVTINWAAANRDGRAFEEPARFNPDRDPNPNLLYGDGIHVCPGAPLARLELRVFVETFLGI